MKKFLIYISLLPFFFYVNNSYGVTDIDPSTLPTITISDLKYKGWFRIKSGTYWESRNGFSQWRIAYNPENNSIFLSSHVYDNAIWEYPLPQIITWSTLQELKITPPPIQKFSKILNRTDSWNTQRIDKLWWLSLINGELLVQWYEYYDAMADNTNTTLVIRDAKNLSWSNVDWFFDFEWRAHTALWTSPIPLEWQSLLWWDYIAWASSAVPINSRSSMWPSAFSFNSSDIIWTTKTWWFISTNKLLDFSLSHIIAKTESWWLPYSSWNWNIQYNYSWSKPPFYEWKMSDTYDINLVWDNDLWTEVSSALYWVIIPWTRTYAVFWFSWMHNSWGWYKITQKNGNNCGWPCAYDPWDYNKYYWFFDVNDLVSVKDWNKLPYEVKPYEYWKLSLPLSVWWWIWWGSIDKSTWNIYLSIPGSDKLQSIYEASQVIIILNTDIWLSLPEPEPTPEPTSEPTPEPEPTSEPTPEPEPTIVQTSNTSGWWWWGWSYRPIVQCKDIELKCRLVPGSNTMYKVYKIDWSFCQSDLLWETCRPDTFSDALDEIVEIENREVIREANVELIEKYKPKTRQLQILWTKLDKLIENKISLSWDVLILRNDLLKNLELYLETYMSDQKPSVKSLKLKILKKHIKQNVLELVDILK